MKRLRTLLGIGLGLAVVVGAGWYITQSKAPAPTRPGGRFGAGGPIPVGTAQAQKGEQIEAYVGRGVETDIRVYEGEVEHFVSAQSEGIGIRVIRDGTLDPTPAYTVPAGTSKENNDSLKTIAVHPKFADNRLVYFAYPISGEKGTTLAVARGKFDGRKIDGVKQIFVADAWETSGNMGGKLLFGPDGTLYVTVGDRDRLCCTGTEDNSLRMKAQSLANDVGKTLRINDDGSTPKDNPFANRAGAKPEIFTYGHRNGYGLAFNPETGVLWQAEIGPMGGDEVNILLPGHNYGWPLVSTGRNYTGTPVSDHPWTREGMDDPRMFWVPSISPSGLIFYTGDRFKGWKNSAFLGALNGKALWRVSFHQPQQAEKREVLLQSLDERIRDEERGYPLRAWLRVIAAQVHRPARAQRGAAQLLDHRWANRTRPPCPAAQQSRQRPGGASRHP